MQQQPADQLVFVDESSTHVAMTPLYARTPRGKRAYGMVPRNKGANISLLAALSRHGMTAAMTVPGAVDGLVFECYIEHVLLPELSPGQTVVMDNLSVHFWHVSRNSCTTTAAPSGFCPPTLPT